MIAQFKLWLKTLIWINGYGKKIYRTNLEVNKEKNVRIGRNEDF